jgi:serine/threonine protein kinase
MSRADDSRTSLDPPSEIQEFGEPLDDPRVLEVVQEYLGELERGRAPSRERYLARYPELAQAVRDCLDGLELVRGGLSHSVGKSISGSVPGPRHTERPPKSLGDFLIVREIARGGMGVVYEAVQQSLGRRVALKVLPFAATFDSRQLQRFKNEAQAAALLHHTNIVPIYAVGCDRGVHFYAMQLIEGQSLAAVIRQMREQAGLVKEKAPAPASDQLLGEHPRQTESQVSTRLYRGDEAPGATPPVTESTQTQQKLATHSMTGQSMAGQSMTGTVTPQHRSSFFRKVARLMMQAAEALEHAHQLGVVHRDIKPGNLMINAAGELWVTDFGLAMFQTETGLTRSGDLLGTFRYMSPEQASGKRAVLDHRTDVYSLGATFYELLALEPVFAGETRAELLYQILHEEPRSLRTWNRAIPVELEIILLKALAKNPEERYATAGELAADVRRFLDHEPILARPPSVWERLKKWSRRHPGAVSTGAVLLGVIFLGLLFSTAMIANAQRTTAAALERERLRANEAEAQFAQARAAVDVLIEVSEEELVDKPAMEATRKRLLRTALEYYQDFIDQRPGDQASQQDLAAVQDRVRGILNDLTTLQRDIQITLLAQPVVCEDLNLTPGQEQRLSELLPKWFGEKMKAFEEMRGSREKDRRRRFVELAAEHDRVLTALLQPEQRERLTQIGIQSAGIYAFREPDIVQALGLTSEQRAQVREIESKVMITSYGRRSMAGGWEERRRQQEQISREAVATALGLLHPEQLQRWEQLVGPPCEGLGMGPRTSPKVVPPEKSPDA